MRDDTKAKEMLEFASCNICGSNRYYELYDIKISPTLTPSKLVKCKECGFIYANPRPKRETEEDYYRRRYHEIQGIEWWYGGRIYPFRRVFKKMRKFLDKGKLIDVGCGMGFFMDLARSTGWEVKGVEISDFAANYAQERLKIDVVKSHLKDAHLEAEYFDAATMWNVLDQIYDPKENLVELNRILKKGGYIFMRMPNLYFHLKVFKLYHFFKVIFKNIENPLSVFHLYSFDKNSIKNLLESTGFCNVIVRPEAMGINVQRFIRIFDTKLEPIVRKFFDFAAEVVYYLTFGKVVVSPSIFVIARKK